MQKTSKDSSFKTIIPLFSDIASESEQGWVMGVTGAILALCFGISAVTTGYLTNFGVQIPMYLAFAGIMLGAVIMFFIKIVK